MSLSAEKLVDKIKFSRSKSEIEKELGLVEEFLSILLSNKQYPAEDYFDMSEEAWMKAIEACVPAKFLELNKKAFALGRA